MGVPGLRRAMAEEGWGCRGDADCLKEGMIGSTEILGTYICPFLGFLSFIDE